MAQTPHSKKIFVTDDDWSYANLIIKTLQNEEYTNIEYFNSGEKCIEHLKDNPDIILLDHTMPKLTGLDTLKKIRELNSDVRIIYLTGQEDPEIAIASLKLGAYDYIIKGDNEFDSIIRIIQSMYPIKKEIIPEQNSPVIKSISTIKGLFFGNDRVQKHNSRQFDSFISFLFGCIILFSLNSCTQNLFSESSQDAKTLASLIATTPASEYKIRKDDKISISIWEHDDISIGSIYSNYNSNEVYGKWIMVDEKGNISIPQLGVVKAEGQSILQLKNVLTELYKALIVEPVIEVRILNREVSLIGEVRTPGNYILDKEKNTLFEMFAKAGDFQPYADKKHVKIIRPLESGSEEYEINLTKVDPAMQNNLLILPGDLIYVPSRKGKMLDIKSPAILPLISILTATAIIYATFNK